MHQCNLPLDPLSTMPRPRLYIYLILYICIFISFRIYVYFFSLYVFGEPVVHFRNFFLCCPSQRSAHSQVPSLGGNPPGDWQSAVGWGDTGFESGTAGQQPGALPLSYHASHHWVTTPPKLSYHASRICIYMYIYIYIFVGDVRIVNTSASSICQWFTTIYAYLESLSCMHSTTVKNTCTGHC